MMVCFVYLYNSLLSFYLMSMSISDVKPDLEIIVSYRSLLCELVKHNTEAKSVIKEKKGAQVAK